MRTHTTGKSCSGASRMQCLTCLRVGMAGFFIATACTPATRQPTVDKPEPKSQKPITTDSSMGRHVYATPYAPGRLQYDLQIFSVTRLLAGDSAHHSDSTHVICLISTTLAAGFRGNT